MVDDPGGVEVDGFCRSSCDFKPGGKEGVYVALSESDQCCGINGEEETHAAGAFGG